VWRISSTDFAFRTHPEDDWGLLRKQLSTASAQRALGGVPPLVLLMDEITGMARFHHETEHLPFGGRSGSDSYQSLTADLDASLERLGPRLRDLALSALSGTYNTAFDPNHDGKPPWVDLFAAGDVLSAALRDPDALIAAFDDALEATSRAEVEDAIVALAWSLGELRAIAELQRGSWRRTQQTVEQYLTTQDA
jgi:hypothetical protein